MLCKDIYVHFFGESELSVVVLTEFTKTLFIRGKTKKIFYYFHPDLGANTGRLG